MGDHENNNHYNKIEEILQYISRKFITLRKDDCYHVNIVLNSAVQSIIDNMIELNALFSDLYEGLSFGGSYWCGLKIKKPDEFDIDLKLHIPDIVNPQLFPDENSGFVRIKLQDIDKLDRNNQHLRRELKNMLDDDNYFVQNKTVSWIYSLVSKSLNGFNYQNNGCFIRPYYNGPAIRLNVCYYGRTFDIDLVLSFVFSEKYWPDVPFRPHEAFEKKTFLTVPKKPKFCATPQNRFFRFSFQEQENEFLNSNYHGKPVFRLLKKLRDTQKQSTSSYVLKTIFLWEVEKRKNEKNEDYWRQPLNVIFFDMLESYKDHMRSHEVLYFWNSNENLIEYTKNETTENIANFIERMIKTINYYIDKDIYIFAKFLLTENEYRQLIHHFRGTPYECSRNDDYFYQKVQSTIYYD